LLSGEQYALTCHHVIFDGKTYPEHMPVPEKDFEKKVYVPSRLEYDDYIRARKADVEAARKRLEILNADVLAGIYTGREDHRATVEQQMKRSIEDAERRVTEASFESWNIGKVAFASEGIHTAGWKGQNRTVDWALVKLNEATSAEATVKLKGFGKDNQVVVRGLCPDGDYTALTCPVRKRGQKTLMTEGRINGVYSDVRVFSKSKHIVTEELVVLPHWSNKYFSRSGDSGAWVVDDKAQLIGMVIGGSDVAPFHTYVADMRHVFDDIHRVTKMIPTIPPPQSEPEDSEAFDVPEGCVMVYHVVFSPSAPTVRVLSWRLAVYPQISTFEVGDQFIL
jgi:hypothetical protein